MSRSVHVDDPAPLKEEEEEEEEEEEKGDTPSVLCPLKACGVDQDQLAPPLPLAAAGEEDEPEKEDDDDGDAP